MMTPTDKVPLTVGVFCFARLPWGACLDGFLGRVQQWFGRTKHARNLGSVGRFGGERAGLEAAVILAQQDGGTVAAVTVLDRCGDPHLEQLTDGVKAQARNRMEDLLAAAGNYARSRGVHLDPILREGHPADTIIDCAEQRHARLVVLGANRDAKAGDSLGDTADLVSNHCPCTVLIVKS